MKKILNISILFILELSFIFVLLFILPSLFINQIEINNESGNYNYLPLTKSKSYTETNTLKYKNLEQIKFLFSNPNLKNESYVDIDIYDSKTIKSITNLSLTGRSIEDPSWVPFKFNLINNDSITYTISSDNENNNNLFIAYNKNDNTLATKFTYKLPAFKESFQYNYTNQINRLRQNIKFLSIYLIIITLLNFIYIKK